MQSVDKVLVARRRKGEGRELKGGEAEKLEGGGVAELGSKQQQESSMKAAATAAATHQIDTHM